MSVIFFYLRTMFARFSFPALFILATFSLLCSCTKSDDEVKGCVYGKRKGFVTEYNLGCMSRSEFNRYVQNPSGNIQGIPINTDLRFVKVDDCLECR